MKYYVRLMRPIYQRAILTLEAPSDDAAMTAALEQAGRLTDKDWTEVPPVQDPPFIEIFLSEDETAGDSEETIMQFMHDIQQAYALLQADLEAGEGSFIAPMWLKSQSREMMTDLTGDWAADMTDICDSDYDEFHDWLAQMEHPTNVLDYFVEIDEDGLEKMRSDRSIQTAEEEEEE